MEPTCLENYFVFEKHVDFKIIIIKSQGNLCFLSEIHF
jgi:hypothetical protein